MTAKGGGGHLDHHCVVTSWLFLLPQGSGNLDAIQIIKKLGGNLRDSYLDEGKLLPILLASHISTFPKCCLEVYVPVQRLSLIHI